MEKHLNIEIWSLDLSVRAINVLSSDFLMIKSADDLIKFDLRNLRGVRNCGDFTVHEITKMQNKLRAIDNQIKQVLKS